MTKKQQKILISIFSFILILILSFIMINKNKKLNLYTKDYSYFNTHINIKIYSQKSDLKVNKILDKINNIFKEYHELTDRYNSYGELTNVYLINNNNLEVETLKLDPKLYEIIEYGIKMYDYSDGLFNINLGNVIDVWKKYRDLGEGIPTISELENSGNIDINQIILKENHEIFNNNPNIDLGSIVKGYVTLKIKDYLIEEGFNSFLINAGGHIVLGEKYHSDLFRIAIRKPDDEIVGNVIVKAENIAISTSGGYERYYEYKGNNYHHIIDPNTLFPSNNMKSVTVICEDSALADILTTKLFLISVEEGKKLIDNLDGIEALWYTNDNQTVRSEGFSNYE